MVRLLAPRCGRRARGRWPGGAVGGLRCVKIYDASGHTERPFGHSDSIPFALAT